MEIGSWAERTCGRAVAGGPSEVASYGTGQARLQLADPEIDLATQDSSRGK